MRNKRKRRKKSLSFFNSEVILIGIGTPNSLQCWRPKIPKQQKKRVNINFKKTEYIFAKQKGQFIIPNPHWRQQNETNTISTSRTKEKRFVRKKEKNSGLLCNNISREEALEAKRNGCLQKVAENTMG